MGKAHARKLMLCKRRWRRWQCYGGVTFCWKRTPLNFYIEKKHLYFLRFPAHLYSVIGLFVFRCVISHICVPTPPTPMPFFQFFPLYCIQLSHPSSSGTYTKRDLYVLICFCWFLYATHLIHFYHRIFCCLCCSGSDSWWVLICIFSFAEMVS